MGNKVEGCTAIATLVSPSPPVVVTAEDWDAEEPGCECQLAQTRVSHPRRTVAPPPRFEPAARGWGATRAARAAEAETVADIIGVLRALAQRKGCGGIGLYIMDCHRRG